MFFSSDLIYIIIALQGLFLATFLFLKKDNRLHVLSMIIIIISIDSINHVTAIKPYTNLINHGNLFALGPLLFVFYSLVQNNEWKKIYSYHLLPFLALKILLLVLVIWKLKVSSSSAILMSFLMAGYNITYNIVLITLMHSKKQLQCTEKSLLFLNYFFLLGWIFALVARVFEIYNKQVGNIFWKISYIVAGMLIYYLIFSFMQFPKIFNTTTYTYKKEKYNNLDSKIFSLLKTEKMFLDPDLKRQDIAIKLGIESHELSFILNNKLDFSFNNLVNRYRVEECIRRFKNLESKNKTILAIGLECGFGSKATFQRAFKKHTGYSPVAYIEKVVSNN